MRQQRHGNGTHDSLAQVLVEFILAAVGLIAMAFVMTRVGFWLNESLVERNRSFQATRVQAGQSKTLVPFDAPADIHLIGPGPARTTGVGSPPPDNFGTACSADDLLAQAASLRQQAMKLLEEQAPISAETWATIKELESQARALIDQANALWLDAQRMRQINAELAGCRGQPPDCTYEEEVCQADPCPVPVEPSSDPVPY